MPGWLLLEGLLMDSLFLHWSLEITCTTYPLSTNILKR